MIKLLGLVLGTVLLAGGLGFGAAQLVLAPPVRAFFESDLQEVLLAGSTEQIRRRFDLGLTPQERVALGETRPEALAGETVTVLELLSTRGDADLLDIALDSATQPDGEAVLASLCVGARLGHTAQLRRVARALPKPSQDSRHLCSQEGRPASEVAQQSGHGGAAEMLREHGL